LIRGGFKDSQLQKLVSLRQECGFWTQMMAQIAKSSITAAEIARNWRPGAARPSFAGANLQRSLQHAFADRGLEAAPSEHAAPSC
jgi:hypothetical protein